MALSDIDKVRLEIGDNNPDHLFLADSDIQYFIDKNGSVRKAALDCARAVLFQLAQLVRFKAGELEEWTSDYFNNYSAALKLYLYDPNYSIAIAGAMPYLGGLSRIDIRNNLNTLDNNVVDIERGIPTNYEGRLVNNNSPFNDYNRGYPRGFPLTPFSV